MCGIAGYLRLRPEISSPISADVARDPDAIYHVMVALSADRDLLARMSAACRARVAAAYSMERLSDQLCRLYSEMFAAKPVKELTGSAPVSSQRPPCAE